MSANSAAGLPPAILLMGPTASGKTVLALEIARRFPVEIISVDSAQVYRGMDLGTAKPSLAERAAVPHHLIDVIDPDQSYSAAQFRSDATRLMQEIASRGRVPLLTGGTMLYFKALREGLSNLPQADAAVRAVIEREAGERGWPALHAELACIDPPTAARLRPGDAQRIQRALEVFRISGTPLSALQGARVVAKAQYRFVSLALVPAERALLHRRIELRFETMLAAGLVAELSALRAKYALSPGLPAMRCVGYRHAWEHLEGAYDRAMLRDRGIYATRQLAKRQLTWLRALSEPKVFDCFAPELSAQVLRFLEASGSLDG
ncbi:MAG: tRNA (adenosine(37)-N6)-dimethylallyltransferase MiaA [Betaproteobacteria bacterium]|nr:MAG: tRNA (adenosine(37)-N6)-dimethylallyltransferase MiaA [Betaproteobacteria bacterium]